MSCLIIPIIISAYSCSTEECTSETIFYELDEISVAEKDSVLVAYDHQIKIDTILAGFQTIDTTEIDDPENPDSTIIKYDTTIINPVAGMRMTNELYGLDKTKQLSVGDSTYFGTEDMKENYSRIMIYFSGLDSISGEVILQIFEGKLYQDCSQW